MGRILSGINYFNFKMISLLLLLGLAVCAEGLGKPSAIDCHLSLSSSGVSLDSYFPDRTEPLSFPLLRVSSGYFDSDGINESCVVVLADCTTCNCLSPTTAVLIQRLNWDMRCIELDASVFKVDRRTIGEDKPRLVSGSPLREDKNAVVGVVPSSHENLQDILIKETASSAFQPRLNLFDVAVETYATGGDNLVEIARALPEFNSPGKPDQPQTTKAPKQRDAYDEMKILNIMQNYIDKVESGPDQRMLGADLNETTTKMGGDYNETTTKIVETTETTAKYQKDTQSNDLDNGSLFSITDDEYTGLFDEMSTWRNKYFVVLGFFLCFTIIFVIIVAILCIKLKKAQSGNPGNLSPGPGCDTEPLTPQVQGGGGNFKFDDGSLPR